MTLNEIFSIYGHRLPTKSCKVFEGDILEWDFAISVAKDEFGLIPLGIACNWDTILDAGNWTQAIIDRDRIKRELEKQAETQAPTYRPSAREAKEWATLFPVQDLPPADIYTDTYFIKFNKYGQITERQSEFYSSQNKYYEADGNSYLSEHYDSEGVHVKYNYETGRLEWLSGKPKLPAYARSTERAY